MRIARRLADLAHAALVVGALVAFGGLGARAHAGPAPDPKIEKADRLFAEGKALLGSNLLQACAKFDASLRENPAAIGTLLNVALCDEKLGRVASAVAMFSEARDRAKEQGLPEHVRAAEEHIAKLAPDVPHVAIKLTEQLPETRILVDDTLIAPDAIGNVAVDPGERVIVVSAPARLPYRTTLVIATAEHRDVVIPALARSVTVTSSRSRIGQITAIVGGAAFGTGVGIGVYARHLHHEQFDSGHCTSDPVKGDRCDAEGQTQTERARTIGNVGTVIGVAGLVTAGVGAYLWFRSPRSTPHDTSDKKLVVIPQVSADGLGVVAAGWF
jgi:type III secretion system FlhB-like substrate exporter